MTGKELLEKIASPRTLEIFAELYGSTEAEAARQRYATLIEEMCGKNFSAAAYGESTADFSCLRVFSAPGRTELGGNHTDHNCGKVLAASIQLDNIAIVQERGDNTVFFRSAGHRDAAISLTDKSGNLITRPRAGERGKVGALIRGIAVELEQQGTRVKGFSANAASTVLTGSGLSSSAAVEVLIGRIFDNLYGGGRRSPLDIAKMGQYAENNFFGKPCGLMDQTACASGGAVAIDFAATPDSATWPRVQCINFDPAAVGYTLCVVNTGGSHADLTPDYAAIPAEMKAVAAFFGKSALAEIDRTTLLASVTDLRKTTGDRALLRALHFIDENERVDAMIGVLNEMDKAAHTSARHSAFKRFLELVNKSGHSSWELLQNVYSHSNFENQGVSVALALSKNFFRTRKLEGACRIHGGGFAGTIQAYIPTDALAAYRSNMETVFGAHSVTAMRIRPLGAVELKF
jgi:galactokinase